MEKSTKNLIFTLISLIAIVAVTYTAYSKLILKSQKTSQNTNTRQTHVKPVELYTKYLQEESPNNGSSSSGTFLELSQGNNSLLSSNYSEGGGVNFLIEGFLRTDLKDFSIWFIENNPTIDPYLFSRDQKVSLLKEYLDYMQTSSWLEWIEREHPTQENDLPYWIKSWETLPASIKQKIHSRTLKIKHAHQKKHSSNALDERTKNLFSQDNQGNFQRDAHPLEKKKVIAPTQSKPHEPYQLNRWAQASQILKENFILIFLITVVLVSITTLIFKATNSARK